MPPAPPALSAAVVPLPHPAVSKRAGLTSKGFTALSIFTTKSIMKNFLNIRNYWRKYLLGIVKTDRGFLCDLPAEGLLLAMS